MKQLFYENDVCELYKKEKERDEEEEEWKVESKDETLADLVG